MMEFSDEIDDLLDNITEMRTAEYIIGRKEKWQIDPLLDIFIESHKDIIEKLDSHIITAISHFIKLAYCADAATFDRNKDGWCSTIKNIQNNLIKIIGDKDISRKKGSKYNYLKEHLDEIYGDVIAKYKNTTKTKDMDYMKFDPEQLPSENPWKLDTILHGTLFEWLEPLSDYNDWVYLYLYENERK